MSAVLFVAIVAYIGLYAWNNANKSVETATVEKYFSEESADADGYVVRTESLLGDGDGTQTVIVSEGEKVSKGQAVAVFYEGQDALEKASQIRALQLGIQEAEEELSAGGTRLPSDAENSVLELSNAVQHSNFDSLDQLTLGVKNRVFTKDKATVSGAELAALQNQLGSLIAGNTGSKTVYAPESGLFSSVVDGYEANTPDTLKDLTPSTLRAMFSNGGKPDAKAVGKLITEIKWYYASAMNTADAQKLKDMKTASVQFTNTYSASIDMAVESVGADESGKSVVVFSAKSSLSDLTALRELTARVVFGSVSGLSIPKAAVHTDGPQPYIYLLTGLQAEKVTVDELGERGDKMIVKDGADSGTVLRAGADVIVKGKDLYDGKVIDK